MRFTTWLWILLLCLPLTVLAAEKDADEFAKGISAAESGKYQQALQHFLRAKQAGMDKPSLDYNLGVTYYRLGKYPEAKTVFTRLAKQQEFAALAYYNLGLITNKQGDEKAAITWFQRCQETATDGKLQTLARTALERLGATSAPKETLLQSWNGFASVSLGYDSNVTQENDQIAGITHQDDSYLELLAVGNHWLQGGRDDGVQLSLLADVQKYSSQTLYDFTQLKLSVARYGRLGDWQTRFTGAWGESYLGGNGYLRSIDAEARGRYDLTADNQLRLRYRLSNLTANSTNADPLNGWRHQLRAGLRTAFSAHSLVTYYQLELNDRDDYTDTGGLFTSYSATRHTLSATAYLDLGSPWSGRLDGRYRFSQYSDANDLSASLSRKREDDQFRLSAQLAHSFAKDWEVEAQYTYYDNQSNIDAYSYNRSVISLGVQHYF